MNVPRVYPPCSATEVAARRLWRRVLKDAGNAVPFMARREAPSREFTRGTSVATNRLLETP
jgi:hypothetical protein